MTARAPRTRLANWARSNWSRLSSGGFSSIRVPVVSVANSAARGGLAGHLGGLDADGGAWESGSVMPMIVRGWIRVPFIRVPI